MAQDNYHSRSDMGSYEDLDRSYGAQDNSFGAAQAQA